MIAERIAALRRVEPRVVPDLRQLRTLVVVGSSSRGGSSIFAEVLRRTAPALHLRAEINPFLRLHGCAGPLSRGDELRADFACDAPALLADIAEDCGAPADHVGDVRAFSRDLTIRLWMQWPEVHVDREQVHEDTVAALAGMGAFDVQLFHALLLARLHRRHPAINPWMYDLSRELIARHVPEARPPVAPPTSLVEEPPFVTIRPWRAPTPEEVRTRPLIVKTPSNAYRLPWLQQLLPSTEIRVLHLARSVAGSVNGLYDGWRFDGFHAHHLPGQLDIAGYSDARPGGRDWWKFDLPPGWTSWTGRRLEEVGAFQWRSAHEHLLAWTGDRYALRFEDFLRAPGRELARLFPWLGATSAAPDLVTGALPAVMATETPRHRRWFARAALLGPILSDPENLRIMRELGYGTDPDEWD